MPPATDEAVDSHHQADTRCAELWWDVPQSVPLPIEILSAETTFPFLETTLANLGIEPTQVQERVLWADSSRTTVHSSAGKIKEKAVMLLELRVKAQRPDNPHLREVLYSTETHSDHSFGRCSLTVLPWINTTDSQPMEQTLSIDIELQPEIQEPGSGEGSMADSQPMEQTLSIDIELQPEIQEPEEEQEAEE